MSGTNANTSDVTGNANAGSTGNDLAQSIAQAVAAAVSTSTNEIAAKLDQMMQSVSELVKKDSISSDNTSDITVTGVTDPYENARRDRAHYDTLQQLSVQALQNAVETANMIGKQAVQINAVAGDRQWNATGLRAGDHPRAGA